MIRNGIYSLLGGGVRLTLGIITIPVLIKIFGFAEYGIYSLVNAIIAFAMLSEWSIATSLTVYLSQDIDQSSANSELSVYRTIKCSLAVVLILASVTAVALLLLITFFPYLFSNFKQSELNLLTRCSLLGVFLVWIRLFQQVFAGLEQSYQEYGPLNLINTAHSILMSVGTLVVAYFSKNLIDIFLLQVLLTLLFTVIHGIFCFRKKLITVNFWYTDFHRPTFVAILRYSLKAWAGSFGSVLFSQGDKIIVGKLLGSEIVGVYAAMTNIAAQINTLSAMPLQTIIPELSQAFKRIVESNMNAGGETFNARKLISAYNINIYLALLFAAAIITLAPEILGIISPGTFAEKADLPLVKYLVFLSVVYAFYSTNALGYYVLLSLQETTIFLLIQLLSGIATLLCIWILSYQYGLAGAIAGNTLYMMVFMFTWFSAKKLSIPVSKFLKALLLPLTGFVLFASIVFSTESLYIRVFTLALFGSYAGYSLYSAIGVFRSNTYIQNSLQEAL